MAKQKNGRPPEHLTDSERMAKYRAKVVEIGKLAAEIEEDADALKAKRAELENLKAEILSDIRESAEPALQFPSDRRQPGD